MPNVTLNGDTNAVEWVVDYAEAGVPKPVPADFNLWVEDANLLSATAPAPDGTQTSITVTIARKGAASSANPIAVAAKGAGVPDSLLYVTLSPVNKAFTWHAPPPAP